MFRKIQSYRASSGSPVVALESKTLETGSIINTSVNLCDKELPEAGLFDLETNIKAKVNLDDVKSTILSKSTFNGDIFMKNFEGDKKETNTNPEVNNNEN